jgi:hypothetical protein
LRGPPNRNNSASSEPLWICHAAAEARKIPPP